MMLSAVSAEYGLVCVVVFVLMCCVLAYFVVLSKVFLWCLL